VADRFQGWRKHQLRDCCSGTTYTWPVPLFFSLGGRVCDGYSCSGASACDFEARPVDRQTDRWTLETRAANPDYQTEDLSAVRRPSTLRTSAPHHLCASGWYRQLCSQRRQPWKKPLAPVDGSALAADCGL